MRLKLAGLVATIVLAVAVPVAEAAISAKRLFSECDSRSDFCRGLIIGILEGGQIYYDKIKAQAEKSSARGSDGARIPFPNSWCFDVSYEAVAQRSIAQFADRVWLDIRPELRAQMRAQGWDSDRYIVNSSGQNILGAALEKVFTCDKPAGQLSSGEPVW